MNQTTNNNSPSLLSHLFSAFSMEEIQVTLLTLCTYLQWIVVSLCSSPFFILVGGVLPFLFALGLYLFQTKLIYIPEFPKQSRKEVWTPDLFQLDFDEVTLPSSSSSSSSTHVMLHAYLIKPSSSSSSLSPASPPVHDPIMQDDPSTSSSVASHRPRSSFQPSSYSKEITVLFFHGNAGNIGHRLPIAKGLVQSLHCNVFMLSYRGYGKSEGTPDEAGLQLDAQAALVYLTSHPILKSVPIYVMGQSIGGAVALHLVANQPSQQVHGLILENTFLSLPKLLPSILPWLSPFRGLCHQVWDNHHWISTLEVPTLFLASQKDELIPPFHMTQLYETCTSSLRHWVPFSMGTHNDAPQQPGYYEAIHAFFKATQQVKKKGVDSNHGSKKLN